MGFPFDLNYRSGDPLAKIRAEDIRLVYAILNGLTGVNCYIEKDATGQNWKVVVADPESGDWPGNDHAFRVAKASPTSVLVSSGNLILKSSPITITDFPVAAITGITVLTYFWIRVELLSATAYWESDSADPFPPAWPASDRDTEIYRVAVVTCANNVISSIKQHQCSDIHITMAAG